MSSKVDLFDSTYSNFADDVLRAIRQETFGVDIGQNSWLTVDEYLRFLPSLSIEHHHHVLEIACGSGGPAIYLANTLGCRVTGIDENENGVATATASVARDADQASRVRFLVADATERLPFEDGTFDALICIDSMNHFTDRPGVLREWHRVLRSGGRAFFTDPVVITGPVTNEELAVRSSIGLFLFVPAGLNERLIAECGMRLLLQEDVTANATLVAGRWLQARARRREDLVRMEGSERFDGLQQFFSAVRDLTQRRALSRIAYLLERP